MTRRFDEMHWVKIVWNYQEIARSSATVILPWYDTRTSLLLILCCVWVVRHMTSTLSNLLCCNSCHPSAHPWINGALWSDFHVIRPRATRWSAQKVRGSIPSPKPQEVDESIWSLWWPWFGLSIERQRAGCKVCHSCPPPKDFTLRGVVDDYILH